MLTKGTLIRSVVNIDGRNWLTRPTQNGMMPAWPGFGPDQDDSTVHPAYRGQLRMAITSSVGTGELRSCLAQELGAKMLARGTEGGGGVVAQRLAVMAKTW